MRRLPRAVSQALVLPLLFLFASSPWMFDSFYLNADKNAQVPFSFSKNLQLLLQRQQQQASAAASSDNPIPHILIFTHKSNLLVSGADEKHVRFFDNIVASIHMYHAAWKTNEESSLSAYNNSGNTIVWFLNNTECRQAISLVEPKLLPHFDGEKEGAFKGDICRGAALHLTGGYYFDVDMQALTAVHLPPHVTFATVKTVQGDKGCFNSFMAATPRHPIVRDYLSIMLDYYTNKERLARGAGRGRWKKNGKPRYFVKTPAAAAVMPGMMDGLVGPFALEGALNAANNNSSVLLLYEEVLRTRALQQQRFPGVTFQNDGTGCCCNFVVHNGSTPLFFSRFVGSTHLCRDAQNQYRAPTAWAERQARLATLEVEYFHL